MSDCTNHHRRRPRVFDIPDLRVLANACEWQERVGEWIPGTAIHISSEPLTHSTTSCPAECIPCVYVEARKRWEAFELLDDDLWFDRGWRQFFFVGELRRNDIGLRLADVAYPRGGLTVAPFTISLDVTERHADPIDYFRCILGDRLFHGWLTIKPVIPDWVDDEHELGGFKSLSWLNPEWYSVAIEVRTGYTYYDHDDDDGMNRHRCDAVKVQFSADCDPWLVANTSQPSLAELDRHLLQILRPRAELRLASDLPIVLFDAQAGQVARCSNVKIDWGPARSCLVLPVEWFDDEELTAHYEYNDRYSSILTFAARNAALPEHGFAVSGSPAALDRLEARLRDLTVRFDTVDDTAGGSPSRLKFAFRRSPLWQCFARQQHSFDDLSACVAFTPQQGASLRWHTYFEQALAAALALAPHLPTYVLLWTLDWLPGALRWTEYRKVKRLEALYASVRRVAAARPEPQR